MSGIETGGPAFPCTDANHARIASLGMTLREYAAIKLKVPNSGTPWLDDMILESLRMELAKAAMHAFISNTQQATVFGDSAHENNSLYAHAANVMAEAMLSARKTQTESKT